MNKLFRLRNVFVALDGVLRGLVPNDKRDEAVTHYSVKGILSDVANIMNLIEKYHGR